MLTVNIAQVLGLHTHKLLCRGGLTSLKFSRLPYKVREENLPKTVSEKENTEEVLLCVMVRCERIF